MMYICINIIGHDNNYSLQMGTLISRRKVAYATSFVTEWRLLHQSSPGGV